MIETQKEFDCILVDSHIDNSDGLTICENCSLELGEGADCSNCQIDCLKRTVEGLRKVVIAAKQADKILVPYWMGKEFGEKPTDKQIYNAIAGLNIALTKAEVPDWFTETDGENS
jgi:hypothetical protein